MVQEWGLNLKQTICNGNFFFQFNIFLQFNKVYTARLCTNSHVAFTWSN